MKFKKGQDRVVVVVVSLGIAIKFPIIHVWNVVRLLYRYMGMGSKQKYHWELFDEIVGVLFRGLTANWGEFLFYWQTGNAFLQPTYLSLFGLMNIQRAGEPCLLKCEDLWFQFDELTEGKVGDLHHFTNIENFCVYKGGLRMLDYGSPASRRVVAQYGTKIAKDFKMGKKR